MNEVSPPFTSARLKLWRSRQPDLKANFVETLNKIEQFGWQTWSVGTNDPVASNFFYTVGVYDTLGLPELFTVGLPIEVGGSTLNYAVRQMREGKDLTQGRIRDVLGGDIEVEFQAIDPRWLHRVMLRTHWYYEGQDVPALQLIYPDLENRFQWDDCFSDVFAQPMLAPGYPMQDLEKEFWDSHDMSFDKAAWRFSDPPHTKIMAAEAVENGSEPITYVAHCEDGTWMICGPRMTESRPVTSRLRRIVASDKSIEALSDLPLGWTAVRDSPKEPWERYHDPVDD